MTPGQIAECRRRFRQADEAMQRLSEVQTKEQIKQAMLLLGEVAKTVPVLLDEIERLQAR